MLKIDLSAAVSDIKKRRAKKIVLQLPEGLKQRTMEIVEELEKKTNAEIIVDIDPCYGACDIATGEARALDADLIVHMGHTQFMKADFPAVYVPLEYEIDGKKLEKLSEKIAEMLAGAGAKKIALCTTAQYVKYIPALQNLLRGEHLKVLVGEGKGMGTGQVLGCNYSCLGGIAAKSDAVVFFGDGLFHAIGISFYTGRKVFAANPLEGEVKEILEERDRFVRRRFALIESARSGKVFAILLSSKAGQLRLKKALKLKKELENAGKKVLLLASDFILPEYLLGIDADVLVNTACPRIALDDAIRFRQPLLNPSEIEILLGKRKIENYSAEELI